MYNSPVFFEETSLPPAGIDRISIEIDDCLIADKSAFHYSGDINKPFYLRKKIIMDLGLRIPLK